MLGKWIDCKRQALPPINTKVLMKGQMHCHIPAIDKLGYDIYLDCRFYLITLRQCSGLITYKLTDVSFEFDDIEVIPYKNGLYQMPGQDVPETSTQILNILGIDKRNYKKKITQLTTESKLIHFPNDIYSWVALDSIERLPIV